MTKLVDGECRVLHYDECSASDGCVIEIREVGGWETNDFGSNVCITGQLVLLETDSMVRKQGEQ